MCYIFGTCVMFDAMNIYVYRCKSCTLCEHIKITCWTNTPSRLPHVWLHLLLSLSILFQSMSQMVHSFIHQFYRMELHWNRITKGMSSIYVAKHPLLFAIVVWVFQFRLRILFFSLLLMPWLRVITYHLRLSTSAYERESERVSVYSCRRNERTDRKREAHK